jgi:GrpB-like predicted nucleotidyltransferase (UPF0157 family)
MRPASELHAEARRILTAERARLTALLSGRFELSLTGGTSVPGALTKGDVDLHLRVGPPAFAATVAALWTVYEVVRPEIWQDDSLATFAVPGSSLPTGVAVTPVGSEHDVRFRRTWDRLAADPALLAEYNAIKQAGPELYEERKSAFFDRLTAGS